jgi:hypothetical protein
LLRLAPALLSGLLLLPQAHALPLPPERLGPGQWRRSLLSLGKQVQQQQQQQQQQLTQQQQQQQLTQQQQQQSCRTVWPPNCSSCCWQRWA